MQKDEKLTLEDLSAATGMTARNVRAYQTKGLIPPPVRQGRRSVYGVEHLRRLQAIERARARGASLSLIASHLAQGRPLDEDTLVEWRPAARPEPDGTRGPTARAEVGALLTALDQRRDPVVPTHLEGLVAAGVLQREGPQVYAGRALADALAALHREGLTADVVLGVARDAVSAATPIAESVRRTVADLDGGSAATCAGHLGEVAGYVVRHLVAAVPG